MNTFDNAITLVDGHKQLATSFEATLIDTSNACGVTYKNQHYLIGAGPTKKQILHLDDCQLKALARELDFDFDQGECSFNDYSVFVCWVTTGSPKQCHQSSDLVSWTTLVQPATYNHRQSQIGVWNIPDTEIFVVGGHDNSHIEIYETSTGWDSKGTYDSSNNVFSNAAILTTPDPKRVYIIGGLVDGVATAAVKTWDMGSSTMSDSSNMVLRMDS